MRFDIYICNFELCECGSIYIFVISVYIYTVRCLYIEFRFICVRFDNLWRLVADRIIQMVKTC